MGILAECPNNLCRKKQSVKNKKCTCGEHLDIAKRSRRVKYYISYRLPSGKVHRELVGKSVTAARKMLETKMVQKDKGELPEIQGRKWTFNDLALWYLELDKVKGFRSYQAINIRLNNFNKRMGAITVDRIRPVDLEQYQSLRKKEVSESTVDQEINAMRWAVNKGWDNDMISGRATKVFKRVERLTSEKKTARDRILSLEEFTRLLQYLPQHSKLLLALGFYSGMRRGEMLSLTWEQLDLENRVIHIQADQTKDQEPRNIPICGELYAILTALPANTGITCHPMARKAH